MVTDAQTGSRTGEPSTILAVADLHGHLTLFERMLAALDEEYGDDYKLVLLGDYMDNGPEIVELIERLVELQHERTNRFVALMGNHDLACLRAMGWEGGEPDERWFRQWSSNFWNHGLGGAAAYGAESGGELAAKMPPHHREFLQGLPWIHVDGEYLFVHAGMEKGALGPQLEMLSRRELLDNFWTQPQLREKSLSVVNDPSWEYTVVSGHCNYEYIAQRAPGPNLPHFKAERRFCLAATADHGKGLWAVALPQKKLFHVGPDGRE